MKIESSTKAAEYAVELFKIGPNCAECVLKSIIAADITDLNDRDIRLATGFGGGIGKYGLTCGALTGAVIAVSSVYGREEPMKLKKLELIKEQLSGEGGIYSIFNELAYEFEEAMGSTVCKEIIDITGENALELKKQKCQKAVSVGSELAYKYIVEKN